MGVSGMGGVGRFGGVGYMGAGYVGGVGSVGVNGVDGFGCIGAGGVKGTWWWQCGQNRRFQRQRLECTTIQSEFQVTKLGRTPVWCAADSWESEAPSAR